MRTWPAALVEHLRGPQATPAICWMVEKRDGTFIRATEHDRDIVMPSSSPGVDISGHYHAGANITTTDITSTTNLSVDNLEVQGALAPTGQVIPDVTIRDIEAGLLDRAPVTVFIMNWRDPSMGYGILRRGNLGEIRPDSDGHYITEVRGLVQAFSQIIVQTYGELCDVVRLGDARCKINIAALTISVTATSVTNRRRFQVSDISASPVGYFNNGILRPLTGINAGMAIERQVKLDDYAASHGYLDLWDALPEDPAPGDTFALEPGCDRTKATCIATFNNVPNFRGKGVYIPGADAMMKGPT